MAETETIHRFTAMYTAHHAAVYGYAVSRAGRQFADDVVSETFLVAWRRLSEVPATPLPWLLAVARNLIRAQYRRQVREQAVATELRAWQAEQHSADIADGVVERSAVLAGLARLSEDDREVLTLVAWHGLSPRQAAEVIGCATATYFVRLHRARRRFTAAMTASRADQPKPVTATVPERKFS